MSFGSTDLFQSEVKALTWSGSCSRSIVLPLVVVVTFQAEHVQVSEGP